MLETDRLLIKTNETPVLPDIVLLGRETFETRMLANDLH